MNNGRHSIGDFQMSLSDYAPQLVVTCNSESFPVSKAVLTQKLTLFLERPDVLATDSEAIHAVVDAQFISEFIHAI
jgi:hypothetical protein